MRVVVDRMDAPSFSVAIRWLHVAAMAVAFGGAVLVTAVVASRPRPALDIALQVARTYEGAFWAAAGILVMTGIGNAAAFGRDLPSAESAWGAAFVAKLVGVGVLVVLSVPRTLVVVQLGGGDGRAAGAVLGRLYIATAAVLVAILGIAVWLAHG